MCVELKLYTQDLQASVQFGYSLLEHHHKLYQSNESRVNQPAAAPLERKHSDKFGLANQCSGRDKAVIAGVAPRSSFTGTSPWIRRCPLSSCIILPWLPERMWPPSCLRQVTEGCGEPRAVHGRVTFSPMLAITSTGTWENNGLPVDKAE